MAIPVLPEHGGGPGLGERAGRHARIILVAAGLGAGVVGGLIGSKLGDGPELVRAADADVAAARTAMDQAEDQANSVLSISCARTMQRYFDDTEEYGDHNTFVTFYEALPSKDQTCGATDRATSTWNVLVTYQDRSNAHDEAKQQRTIAEVDADTPVDEIAQFLIPEAAVGMMAQSIAKRHDSRKRVAR